MTTVDVKVDTKNLVQFVGDFTNSYLVGLEETGGRGIFVNGFVIPQLVKTVDNVLSDVILEKFNNMRGVLIKGVKAVRRDNGIDIVARGEAAQYARALDQGATIKAKRSTYLTIPIRGGPADAGGGRKTAPLTSWPAGSTFAKMYGNYGIVFSTSKNKQKERAALFYLVPSVKIRGRDYTGETFKRIRKSWLPDIANRAHRKYIRAKIRGVSIS